MVINMFYALMHRLPSMKRLRSKFWYEYVSGRLNTAPVLFMNYGYLNPLETEHLELEPADEPNRTHIQLYHHVASAIDLRGLDVLEIGCGRGGGSSYIQRYLGPKSVLGVDRTDSAIQFCQGHYAIPGLSFKQTDAEKLALDDNSFDAVVNVESSHCYANVDTFLAEVYRVLRPGGHFLFADLRPTQELDELYKQLDGSGLEMLGSQVISFQVFKSMEAEGAARRALALRYLPFFLRGLGEIFVGAEGSHTYTELRERNTIYKSFVLRKPL